MCNRNSKHKGCISKHTGGSITITRTRQRIKEKRKLSMVELFKVTHTKKGSDGALVTPKATDMLDDYHHLAEKTYEPDPTSQPKLGDLELWKEVTGGVKKGRIYGFGAPCDPHYVITGTPVPSSDIRSYEQATSDEVRRLKEELQMRDEQIAEQQRTFEQRVEERIQQVQRKIQEQMKIMEQVTKFSSAPIGFNPPPPPPPPEI